MCDVSRALLRFRLVVDSLYVRLSALAIFILLLILLSLILLSLSKEEKYILFDITKVDADVVVIFNYFVFDCSF